MLPCMLLLEHTKCTKAVEDTVQFHVVHAWHPAACSCTLAQAGQPKERQQLDKLQLHQKRQPEKTSGLFVMLELVSPAKRHVMKKCKKSILQTLFRRATTGGITKCWLFLHAREMEVAMMWRRSYVNVFFSVLLHFPNAIVFCLIMLKELCHKIYCNSHGRKCHHIE